MPAHNAFPLTAALAVVVRVASKAKKLKLV